MLLNCFLKTFKTESKILKVFLVLKDNQWHCRGCEYEHVGSTQIAGGGGIQGLEKGSRNRPGIIIESQNFFCPKCDKSIRHDRWEGNFHSEVQGKSLPRKVAQRIITVLRSRDIVENTERPLNQLTIDHKFPMIRWDTNEANKQTDYTNLTDKKIRARFQLLKKSNGSISHNLLKSRACEKCYKEGKRGTPFGIKFFYAGDETWSGTTKKDPKGCIGCGWFDFDKWRAELNKRIRLTLPPACGG